MEKEFIIITLADDDEDDRLFFEDAFDELKINCPVELALTVKFPAIVVDPAKVTLVVFAPLTVTFP